MAAVPIRKPYDGKRYKSQLVFLDAEGEYLEPVITEQCHKDACDVDNIIRQYDRTGLITHVNQAVANYGDFTLVNEYQESLNMVIQADNAFMDLPAKVRSRFGNDAGAFFEFATDPANSDEMVKLGLADAPVIPDPAPVVEPDPVV